MIDREKRSGRIRVRAENPSGACGYVDHMTIDELQSRAVGDNFDGSCPVCGRFHLTRADIEVLKAEKISESDYFEEMRKEAEQG